MLLKDHYKTLGIEPGATVKEIKQAFRRLALQYHPDKSKADPETEARYMEIKEAYEVLTNPGKKEQYLQLRWYEQSQGRKINADDIQTPLQMLTQSLELNKFAAELNHFRIDRASLQRRMELILSDANIDMLEKFGDPETNKQIRQFLLEPVSLLGSEMAEPLVMRLQRIVPGDGAFKLKTAQMLRRLNRQEKKRNYEPWIVIIVTILLCLLIFLMGR